MNCITHLTNVYVTISCNIRSICHLQYILYSLIQYVLPLKILQTLKKLVTWRILKSNNLKRFGTPPPPSPQRSNPWNKMHVWTLNPRLVAHAWFPYLYTVLGVNLSTSNSNMIFHSIVLSSSDITMKLWEYWVNYLICCSYWSVQWLNISISIINLTHFQFIFFKINIIWLCLATLGYYPKNSRNFPNFCRI